MRCGKCQKPVSIILEYTRRYNIILKPTKEKNEFLAGVLSGKLEPIAVANIRCRDCQHVNLVLPVLADVQTIPTPITFSEHSLAVLKSKGIVIDDVELGTGLRIIRKTE